MTPITPITPIGVFVTLLQQPKGCWSWSNFDWSDQAEGGCVTNAGSQCKGAQAKGAGHKLLAPRMPQASRSDQINAKTADTRHGRRTGSRTPPLRNLFTACSPIDGPKLPSLSSDLMFFPNVP